MARVPDLFVFRGDPHFLDFPVARRSVVGPAVGPAVAAMAIRGDNDSRVNAVLIDDGFGQDQSPDTESGAFQTMLSPGTGPRDLCCNDSGDGCD
jgi:hypothetical protein